MGLPLEVAFFTRRIAAFHYRKTKLDSGSFGYQPSLRQLFLQGSVASSARVLILIPALALLTGEMMAGFWRAKPRIGAGLFLAIFVCTSIPSLALVSLHRQEPLQMQASQWIEDHIPTKASIGIPRDIFWWTPDTVYASYDHPERLKTPYHIINFHYSPSELAQQKPDYLVISQLERDRCELWAPASDCKNFFGALDARTTYEPVMTFQRRIGFKNWEWKRPETPVQMDDDFMGNKHDGLSFQNTMKTRPPWTLLFLIALVYGGFLFLSLHNLPNSVTPDSQEYLKLADNLRLSSFIFHERRAALHARSLFASRFILYSLPPSGATTPSFHSNSSHSADPSMQHAYFFWHGRFFIGFAGYTGAIVGTLFLCLDLNAILRMKA